MDTSNLDDDTSRAIRPSLLRSRRPSRLSSPVFLGALALLLVNDFILKPTLHNWATGKLSDAAGLFAFTWFWMDFVPRQRIHVGLAIAAAFLFWKSPYSQPAIEVWN